ncbi:hypothetical protein FNF28_07322 [Cafeteria roenbergensis]|nr:hypothetical protein FNF28_07322 [Cafeteria roenbergensis]
MSYNRWVLLARHEKEFGRRSSMLLTNAAFMGMLGFIVADAAQHHRQHVNKAYLDRKTAINAKVTEDWSSERELHDLNVSELEESVFRARKGVQHSSLTVKDDSGKDVLWHKVTMVSMPLPIAELAEFAPAPRS